MFALLVVRVLVAGSCARGNGNLRVSVQNTDGSPIIGAKVVSESQPEGQLKITGITTEESAGAVAFNESSRVLIKFRSAATDTPRKRWRLRSEAAKPRALL